MVKEARRKGRIHYDANEKECARRTDWLETCEMLRMRAGVLGTAKNGTAGERAGGSRVMYGMRPAEGNGIARKLNP